MEKVDHWEIGLLNWSDEELCNKNRFQVRCYRIEVNAKRRCFDLVLFNDEIKRKGSVFHCQYSLNGTKLEN